MATKEDIKKAILSVAGNPVSGGIASLADEMADAVFCVWIILLLIRLRRRSP